LTKLILLPKITPVLLGSFPYSSFVPVLADKRLYLDEFVKSVKTVVENLIIKFAGAAFIS